MSLRVTTVRGRRETARFIDFPHDLYRGDPQYVPQLFRQQKELLDPRRHPFYHHAERELFLARRDGRIVGRVAAIINRLGTDPQQGFFGFLDCEDDPAAAGALLEAASNWLRELGMTTMRGPVNPDMNHSCGILIGGFDLPPVISMPYNAAYYRDLLEGAGFEVCKELNAWDIPSNTIPREAFRIAETLRIKLEYKGYVLRYIDRRNFAAEAEQLRMVYNDANAHNWGATPLTTEEFGNLAHELLQISKPDLIQVGEYDGKIVGFIGAVPDINEILPRLHRGRLWPFGWLKLLLGLRGISGSRIVIYGVDPDHRGTGLANWLYLSIIRALRRNGYAGAEASYVLEDNHPVNGISARLGGVRRKRYAILEKPLGAGMS